MPERGTSVNRGNEREHYAFVPSPKNRLSQRFLRGHLASSWSECLLFKPIPYLLAL